MDRPTFVLYIDESGEEGFNFSRGSTEWFVLSGIITRKAKDLETVKIVDEIRFQLKKPDKKPLHFRKLIHEQRLPFVDKIAKSELRIISVLVHKPSIKEPEKFQKRYRLYFYATRYLLERASWYCLDHKTNHDQGNGKIEIVFSNRSGMSYEEMKEYFTRLKTSLLNVQIDWNIINPDLISSYTSGKRMGLQIADAVASSFFYSVQRSQYGYTEDHYVRLLKPVVYHRRGQYLGYGIKFWPKEMDYILKDEKYLEWIKHYK